MNIFVKYDNIFMDWINICVNWYGFNFDKFVYDFVGLDLF